MKILKRLRALNTLLTIVVTILVGYIFILPTLPEIAFAMNSREYMGYAFNSEATFAVIGDKARSLPAIPETNRVVIPEIFVNTSINEGVDESVLLQLGMWHRPNTSTPEKGGNTVIAGHRFLHTRGSDTFYHLDKVEIDDVILIYWEGKEYVYKVFEIIEVGPEQIEVEYNTKDPIITLYTCTPLWTSEKRLVVKAALQ